MDCTLQRTVHWVTHHRAGAGTDEDRLLYDIVSKDRLLSLCMGQDGRSKMDV